MDPYEQAARHRADELARQMQELQQRAVQQNRDLTEDELSSVYRLGAEYRTVQHELQDMTEQQARSEAVQNVAAQVHGAAAAGEAGPWQQLGHVDRRDPYRDAGEVYGDLPSKLMPSRDDVAQLYRAAVGGQSMRVTVSEPTQVETRAAVTTSSTGVPALALDTRQPNEPRRLATSARLLTQVVTGIEPARYPVFGAGAADVTAEGATKPEYAAVTPGSATPQMIAVWTDITRQTIATLVQFDTALRDKLARLIAVREDKLLVATALATSGIQVYNRSAVAGEKPGDSLLGAAALVVGSDVSADPDVAVINPADVQKVFGGSFGVQGETPERQLRLELHGMLCYVSSAVAAGTALVGAWQACSRFVDGTGGVQYLVDAMSQLKSNKVTLLGEEAVALAVEEPAGFVNVTFATS